MSLTTLFRKHNEPHPPPPYADPRPWSQQQRPAVLLQGDPAGTDKVTLGNVRWGFLEAGDKPSNWQAIYRDTTFDPSHIKNVYVSVREIMPMASHTYILFEFDKDAPVQAGTGQQDSGLAFSMEARLKQGDAYSLTNGFERDRFSTVYQVGTWKDAVQKACRLRGYPIKRYQLDLSDQQKQSLLRACVSDALADRTHDSYNTYNNSCVTATFRELNAILPNKFGQWIVPDKVHDPLTSIPDVMGPMLNAKGLSPGSSGKIITLPHGKSPAAIPWWARLPIPSKWLGPVMDEAIQRAHRVRYESADAYSMPTAADAESSVVH